VLDAGSERLARSNLSRLAPEGAAVLCVGVATADGAGADERDEGPPELDPLAGIPLGVGVGREVTGGAAGAEDSNEAEKDAEAEEEAVRTAGRGCGGCGGCGGCSGCAVVGGGSAEAVEGVSAGKNRKMLLLASWE
jgi:hypothetical protein